MNYEIVTDSLDNVPKILKIEAHQISFIPFDESNTEYRQYLVDTDGGLPLPEKTKEDK
jgi:hypothetical protein